MKLINKSNFKESEGYNDYLPIQGLMGEDKLRASLPSHPAVDLRSYKMSRPPQEKISVLTD